MMSIKRIPIGSPHLEKSSNWPYRPDCYANRKPGDGGAVAPEHVLTAAGTELATKTAAGCDLAKVANSLSSCQSAHAVIRVSCSRAFSFISCRRSTVPDEVKTAGPPLQPTRAIDEMGQ